MLVNLNRLFKIFFGIIQRVTKTQHSKGVARRVMRSTRQQAQNARAFAECAPRKNAKRRRSSRLSRFRVWRRKFARPAPSAQIFRQKEPFLAKHLYPKWHPLICLSIGSRNLDRKPASPASGKTIQEINHKGIVDICGASEQLFPTARRPAH